MNENTIFFRNIPFEYPEEDFKQKMRQNGKTMYVRYVKKSDQFNGSAFVRFLKKEDAEKLFSIDQKIKENPEIRTIVDPNSLLQINERILHIFRPIQKSQEIDPLDQILNSVDKASELFQFYTKDVSKKRNLENLFKGLPVL